MRLIHSLMSLWTVLLVIFIQGTGWSWANENENEPGKLHHLGFNVSGGLGYNWLIF